MFVVAATTAPHPGGVICSPSSHRMADSTLTNWSTRRCQTTNIQPLTGLVRGADSIYKHSTPDGVVSRSVSSKCPNSTDKLQFVVVQASRQTEVCRTIQIIRIMSAMLRKALVAAATFLLSF